MVLTKKHFKKVAELIKYETIAKENHKAISYHLINSLVLYFKAENPLFDKEQFLRACGLSDSEISCI